MNRGESALHKYIPQPLALITFGGSTSPAGITCQFRVPVPDSRLRVKVSVLFVPQAGRARNVGALGTSTLWLAETDDDLSGLSGIAVPSTDIEGTAAAPTTIPASPGLGGYSREFVSAADAIEGLLTSTFASGMVGTWMLQTRYQPNAVRFTYEEWDRIKAGCNPQLITPAVVRA